MTLFGLESVFGVIFQHRRPIHRTMAEQAVNPVSVLVVEISFVLPGFYLACTRHGSAVVRV